MLEISRLKGIEKDAALALALEVFLEFEAPDYEAQGVETFKDFIGDPVKTDPVAVYGAYLNDLLVGMAGTRNGGRHLALLFVRPSHHRQGIAKALLDVVKRKCPETTLTVNSSPYAREIYGKLGFEATEEEKTQDGIRYTPMKLDWARHVGTVALETPRLVLRPFRLEDAEAMYKNWAWDPEVTRFLTWEPHPDAEESARILAEWVPQYNEKAYYNWAITLKHGDAAPGSEVLPDVPIGGIGAVKVDEAVNSVHIGYCIGRPWWHRGLMSEALGRLLEFFFLEVGVNRVDSRHDPDNPHSGEVMTKCGMVREGLLREADRSARGICDTVWHGILAEDYLKGRTDVE